MMINWFNALYINISDHLHNNGTCNHCIIIIKVRLLYKQSSAVLNHKPTAAGKTTHKSTNFI